MNLKLGPRKFAACVVCDAAVYEVITFHPDTKQPRQLGAAIDGAVQAILFQVDGRRVELSLCAACAAQFDREWQDLLPAVWERIILATVAQRDHRKDEAWVNAHNRAIVDLVGNPPIAYVGCKPLESPV